MPRGKNAEGDVLKIKLFSITLMGKLHTEGDWKKSKIAFQSGLFQHDL